MITCNHEWHTGISERCRKCGSRDWDDNPSIVCNELNGSDQVCLLPVDHKEAHDFVIIARGSVEPDEDTSEDN